jgi:DNA-binding Xre family transcriptional regulator
MVVSYDKLWKLLIDKKMKKVDLMRKAHISSNALSHLSKDKSVSIDVIGKVCCALECTPNDILEFYNNATEVSTEK